MILSDTTNILIAGGGASDVLLPGLAVADELRDLVPRSRIIFAGSGSASEYRQIRDAGYEYLVAGGDHNLRWSRDLLHRLLGPSPERQILKQTRPSLVLSMGGEVGESMGRVAAKMAVPLVVFEPYVELSQTTRRLAPSADLVCLGFEQSRSLVSSHCPIRVTGIPVKRAYQTYRDDGSTAPPATDDQPLRRLIILGDDGNSRMVNSVLPRVLWELDEHLMHWRVVHRAKAEEVRPVRQLYAKFGIDAVATAHIHKLPDLLARADLVIAATSLMEFVNLAAAARPTVAAVESATSTAWQAQAAHKLAQSGACVVVDDVEDRSKWTRALEPLLTNARRRQQLRVAMRQQFRRDAAWHVASMIRDMVASAERTRSA
jgi:UDP-N-acetylglucosamine--N-acetylmuramyl-(pentapeptide) pyrophosphoryl-undecaprenol N-acetylglucosamine transferase